MNKIGFVQRVLFCLIISFSQHCIALAGNSCPPTDVKALQQLIATHKPKKLMFFSSWCSDCLSHLKSSEAEGVILVAAFDKQQKAEKTLDKLKIRARVCVFDNGLARHYGIKTVPAEVQLPTN